MSTTLLDYPPHYLRGRAEQTRALARTTICGATLAMLDKRAAEYDRMAELLENATGSAFHRAAVLPNPENPVARSGERRGELRP